MTPTPFRAGLETERAPAPCVFVIFGASGDLTRRKLIPALYNLAVSRLLPPGMSIVGFALTEIDEEQFRKSMREAVGRLTPVLEALAPGVDAAVRTPGREGDASPEEQGWLHCGPSGAGHFVKMVHNGIEYGLMQAYAEGLNVLEHADVGKHAQETDAETTPLRDPDLYQYDLDIAAVTELWRRGSVISSWLLDLTAEALHATPELDEYAGHVSDSGEGRWTVQAAVEEGVPTPVLAASLFNRFASRGEADFGDRVLSAMRKGFGGHLEKSPEQ